MSNAKNKIHVLHIITDLSTGGAQMMLYKLLSQMDKQHFHCQVICLMGEDVMAQKISALGVSVKYLHMRKALPNPLAFFRLVQMLKSDRADIVQTWLYHADFLGGLAAKLAGVKAVIWNIRHNNLDAAVNKWHTRMTAKLCARLSYYLPKAIICNSANSIAVHQAIGYNKMLFTKIGNGFDLQWFQPNANAKKSLCCQLQLPQDSLLIGLVARYDPQKDQQNFIRAIAAVISEAPKVQAIMIGKHIDNNNQQLQQWLADAGLRAHFHLLGERDDVALLTAALDIACLSSLGEGFPNAIGEAMSCAVPCVVTDVGDAAELVGETGVAVPAADYQALAVGLKQLINLTQEQRRQLGDKARQRIAQYYSLEVIVHQYQDVYQQIFAATAIKECR